MKTIIVCASTHHGNTAKIVDAIKKAHDEVEVIDATKEWKDLSEYDLIGFASGIYAGRFHKSVLDCASQKLPNDKKVFFIDTSASGNPHTKSIEAAIAGKNATVVGTFECMGYNTFGPFKLIGGTGKGRPNQTDFDNAVAFFEGLIQ